MRIVRRLLPILMFVLLPVFFAGQSEARTLTIEDAVAEALRSNQDYLIARSELEKAEAEIQKATADAYPHLSLGSTYTRYLDGAGSCIWRAIVQDGVRTIKLMPD